MRVRWLLDCAAALVLQLALAFAPGCARAAVATLPTVVFLGDSIAAGLHVGPTQSFPALLHQRAERDGWGYAELNASASGATLTDGLRRLGDIAPLQPVLLVIELGGNDGLAGRPIEQIEQDLTRLVQRARDSGSRVLLLGVRLPAHVPPNYARAFEAVYPRVAAACGVRCVPDFFSGVIDAPALLLDDQVHPRPAGHALLAERLEPVLREELDRIAAATVSVPPAR